jgi:hypothetical protein
MRKLKRKYQQNEEVLTATVWREERAIFSFISSRWFDWAIF